MKHHVEKSSSREPSPAPPPAHAAQAGPSWGTRALGAGCSFSSAAFLFLLGEGFCTGEEPSVAFSCEQHQLPVASQAVRCRKSDKGNQNRETALVMLPRARSWGRFRLTSSSTIWMRASRASPVSLRKTSSWVGMLLCLRVGRLSERSGQAGLLG